MTRYPTTHDVLRARLLEAAGLLPQKRFPPLEVLREREWSPRFEVLMRNRLILGGMRYGFLNEPGKPQYDRITAIISRCERYRKDRNRNHLVDMANLALLEFEEGEEGVWDAGGDEDHVQRAD